MVKAGEKATSSSRRRRSRETFSVFAVITITAALAAVMLGLSSAQAHTTTATLFPNGQGTYTAWTNGEDQIDETGTPDCGTGESVIESTGNDRESVLISLATVPDGATITSVDVQVWHRGDSAAGGTFQTFARLNGTDTDSGTNIAAVGTSGGCCGPRHAEHQRRRHRQGGRHGARSRRPQDGRQRGDRSRWSHPRDRDLQPRPVGADARLARRRCLD